MFVGVFPITGDRPRGVEPVAAEELVERRPRPPLVEDVRLRPARHRDQLARHVVVADEVVGHRLVLDDVPVELVPDDPLADGVVPARDVADRCQPEPAPEADERRRGLHLEVREDDRRPLRLEPPPERARDVAPRREVPAAHRPVDPGPHRERADTVRVEQVVPVPRCIRSRWKPWRRFSRIASG